MADQENQEESEGQWRRRICWNKNCNSNQEAKLLCGNCKCARYHTHFPTIILSIRIILYFLLHFSSLFRYCSKDCQKASWNENHKRECKGIAAGQTLMDESLAVDFRFVAFTNHQLDVHFDAICKHFPGNPFLLSIILSCLNMIFESFLNTYQSSGLPISFRVWRWFLNVISQYIPEFWPVIRRLLTSDVTGLENRIGGGIYLCWFANIVSFCHGEIVQGSQGLAPGRIVAY